MRACLALFLAAATACSSGSTDSSNSCPQNFPVRVDSAQAIHPQFSWGRACPAYRVTVTYVDSASAVQTVWSVQTSVSNLIEPPVSYGVAPPGVTGQIGPFGITPGVTYDVDVARWDSVVNGPGASGHASFVH
jgi:hypothetical protein